METLKNKLNLVKALLAFQGKSPVIEKTKEATVNTRSGSSYKYKFSPLPVIMRTIQPELSKNKLGIIHLKPVENKIDDTVTLTTTLMHESGEFIETTTTEPVSKNLGSMSHIQAIGSITTFLKRFHIGELLNIVTEEDTDGKGLGDPKDKKPKKDKSPIKITTFDKTNKKTEDKPNPNYIKDIKGLRRYNKVTHQFDGQYQKDHNLITSKEWKTIENTLKELKIESKVFLKWLSFAYKDEKGEGRKFFDIKKEEYPHILDVLKNDPGIITDIPEK